MREGVRVSVSVDEDDVMSACAHGVCANGQRDHGRGHVVGGVRADC